VIFRNKNAQAIEMTDEFDVTLGPCACASRNSREVVIEAERMAWIGRV
jgi:hypothetical protein